MINHLQDCQEDYREMDRVYLPTQWLDAAGADVSDLDRAHATPALRSVLDRVLDAIDAMLVNARPLPSALNSRRLAMEASAIYEIAVTLSGRLRRLDPLATRVALSKFGYVSCCARGVVRVWL
jgi:phytoene/squalene synthetase